MLDLSIGEVGAQLFLRGPGITEANLDPEPALLSAINHARHTIYALVFSITLEPVAQALIAAAKRGVGVHVVSDATEYKGKTSQVPALVAAGIDVRLWGGNYREAHDKLAVIDEDMLITGSYNWTSLAEQSNIENMIILTGSRVTKYASPAYMVQWQNAYDAGTAATIAQGLYWNNGGDNETK